MKQAIKYGAILIGLYLGAYYATGAGTLISKGTSGATGVIKALQGRT